METRGTHSQSPQPSPHGAIGEYPSGGSGLASGNVNVGVNSQHTRAPSFTTRPRTPLVTPATAPGSSAAAAAAGDELDLNALMAHGQRQLGQLQLDDKLDTRSRFGRFSAHTRADSPSRWESRSRETSMHRQPSTNGTTTAHLAAFLDPSFPSPIGTGIGGPTNAAVGSGVGRARAAFPAPPAGSGSDPSAAVTHHLNALNSLLNPLIGQQDEIIRLRAEVELWRGEWQRCDRERRRLEDAINMKNNEPVDGPAFSVVLLDGDGFIFQDQFLREGYAGGQRAARALVSALPTLSAVDEKRDLGSIVVKVFANKQGLGQALTKAGSVPSWTAYDGFWQGFTSAHDLFCVVDAGMGKEAADHKIREYLKLYAAHRQCSTIFLGASHDNSYAAVISSVETTAGLSKLVLLQGYSNIAQSLKQYKTRFATIPDLFRTSPVVINDKNTLPGVPALTTPKSPAAKRRSLPPPSKETSKEKEVDSDKGGKTKSTAKDKFAPKDTKEKSSKKVAPTATPKGKPPPLPKRPIKATDDVWFPPDELGDDSDEDSDGFGFGSDAHSGSLFGSESDHESTSGWSVRRGKSFAQSFARPRSNSNAAANASSTKKKPLKKNKPAARAGSVATVRNLKPRPCHTFYLSPWGCKNGKACEYSHEYNLDDEQREELSRLAKEIICPYVRSKRCHFSEDECVYGHHCPRGERCTFGETCRFKDLPNGHGEDD